MTVMRRFGETLVDEVLLDRVGDRDDVEWPS